MGNQIIQGHCIDVMRSLPASSVDCVITSIPYWNKRDYEIEPVVWGGDPDCDHDFDIQATNLKGSSPSDKSTLREGRKNQKDEESWSRGVAGRKVHGGFCTKCNAWLGQYGLEPDPQLFIDHTVLVFREVWRVLKESGTAWVNIGDTYASGGFGGGGYNKSPGTDSLRGWRAPPAGLKRKDLCMIPARVAIALQGDGWWLRSEIIWSKRNPMPESAKDRPTTSHEMIYLLSKAEHYYYDHEAIKESAVYSGNPSIYSPAGWADGPGGHGTVKSNCKRPSKKKGSFKGKTGDESFRAITSTRNKRTVWEVTSEPSKDAHFAIFPQKLIEPCVLAGSPSGGVVLDPFGGSGQTGRVAQRAGRSYILIDIKPEYVDLMHRNLSQQSLL